MADPLSITNGSEDCLCLRDEIWSTVCLLEMLKDRVEDIEAGEVWCASIKLLNTPSRPLDQFKRALERLVAKLAPTTQLQQMTQTVKWPFDKADVAAILETIECQKTLFNLVLQNNHIKLTKSIKSNIQEFSKDFAELKILHNTQQHQKHHQESYDIIAWISLLNFMTKQIDVLDERQEGTGAWLFKSVVFQKWLLGSEKTLWCQGMPGAGKTVLVSIVIDHLQRTYSTSNISIVFIYCDYKEQAQQTLLNLISSLLQQLVEQQPSVSDEVCSLWEEHTHRRTRPGLADFSRLLQSTASTFSKIFIVIDALDESSEVIRNDLIIKINKLQQSLHLLASDADIRAYIHTQIDRRDRLKRFVQADPSLQEKIVTSIASKAQGMFLLARLHIESLEEKQDRKAVRLALKRLLQKLNETYDKALKWIESQNEDDVRLAERILTWISFATRPLEVKEMQHAIAVMKLEPGDTYIEKDRLPEEDLLLTVCAGIVIIDKESNIIRLVHYTTQEYFE
ncbi:MAG: hypothetical protein M1827_006267 [Pycnora praestabilis]|nr:MAG: hypothetical protein M1827_006267 [Pycnora praestabilis]